MSLNDFKMIVLDEEATFHHRRSLLKKLIDGEYDEVIADTENVSILNLLSLKRGNMTSKSLSAKLEFILEDKQRLNTWINSYEVQFRQTGEKDSVKIATFLEAATRLKMLLDHCDFDDGDYRIARCEAIKGIDDMLGDISRL